MGVHSGRFAIVNGVSTVRGWVINETVRSVPNVASNTRGGTFRRKGVKDWTGSVRCYGGIPAAMPNDYFAFVGYTAPSDEVATHAGEKVSGAAIVDSIDLQWDWSTGEVVSHVINFSAGTSALTRTSAVQATDTTQPQMPVIIGHTVQYNTLNGGSGQLELQNVVRASLSIRASTQPYVNSSTNGNTFRRGGPIDFDVSIDQQNESRITMGFDLNDDVDLLLPVPVSEGASDPQQYWELRYCHVDDFTNLEVNRETGAIIAQTIRMSMNGYDFVGAAIGEILRPDGQVWWPFAG